MQVTSALNRQPMGYDRSHYQQEMARAKAQQQQMYPGVYNNTQRQTQNETAAASEAMRNVAQNAQSLQRQYANQAIVAQQRLAALAQQGQQEQVGRQRAIAAYQQQLQAQQAQQQQRSRPGILGPAAAKGRDSRRKPRSG